MPREGAGVGGLVHHSPECLGASERAGAEFIETYINNSAYHHQVVPPEHRVQDDVARRSPGSDSYQRRLEIEVSAVARLSGDKAKRGQILEDQVVTKARQGVRLPVQEVPYVKKLQLRGPGRRHLVPVIGVGV
jgi:hypothetical protein